MDDGLPLFDSISNISLIENNLAHILFEMRQSQPSHFRIAREAHQCLLRSLVHALNAGNGLAITTSLGKRPSFQHQRGNEPWKEVHKESIGGCAHAWRFSAPAPCPPPEGERKRITEPGRRLLAFYDLLAMAQSDIFMGQYTFSRPLSVADKDMKTLEWLHENVRNEYEHFAPKFYSAPITDLVAAAELCLRLTEELLFRSGNGWLDEEPRARIAQLLQEARAVPPAL